MYADTYIHTCYIYTANIFTVETRTHDRREMKRDLDTRYADEIPSKSGGDEYSDLERTIINDI